jgi:hypothetical protein
MMLPLTALAFTRYCPLDTAATNSLTFAACAGEPSSADARKLLRADSCARSGIGSGPTGWWDGEWAPDGAPGWMTPVERFNPEAGSEFGRETFMLQPSPMSAFGRAYPSCFFIGVSCANERD